MDAEPYDKLQFKWFVNSSASSVTDVRDANVITGIGAIGGGASELIDLETFSVNYTTSIATYTPKTRHGYDQLVCMAENAIGKQQTPCVYNIVPAGQSLFSSLK